MAVKSKDIAVAVYDDHATAEEAVKTLQRAGVDMKKISIVCAIEGGMEGAVVVGASSGLAGALAAIGVPKDSVLQYESELKANKFLLVLAGDTQEIEKAREALEASDHASFDHHAGTSETPTAAAA